MRTGIGEALYCDQYCIQSRAVESGGGMRRQAGVELELRPLSPVLGAEVIGVDLARGTDDVLFGALRDAFLRHQLLVFRNQTFDQDQHVAFARRWGKIQRPVLSPYLHPGKPKTLRTPTPDPNT